jgi:spore coat polysaccharide biosynthesis predicted glycosyltransferase SpsG
MRFLFRADAGISRGTGHVMRCLTLAAELAGRGHETALLTGPIEIGWLRAAVLAAGVALYDCEFDTLPMEAVREFAPDWVIVDSYRIPAELVSEVGRHVSVLAIIDGDDREIDASLYLDQNLGAETRQRSARTATRFLAGARYALVRRQVVDAMQPNPWQIRSSRPRVLCFMGGTDATGSIVGVTEAIAALDRPFDLTVVAALAHHPEIEAVMSGRASLRMVVPTPELPELLADANIVVCAAGTSAWDICTLGIPAVFVGVVDNQRESLREVVARGLAFGVDTTETASGGLRQVGVDVESLLDDSGLREQFSRRSRAEFDGRGAARVAERLERQPVGALLEW